jgi:hypothetical protein
MSIFLPCLVLMSDQKMFEQNVDRICMNNDFLFRSSLPFGKFYKRVTRRGSSFPAYSEVTFLLLTLPYFCYTVKETIEVRRGKGGAEPNVAEVGKFRHPRHWELRLLVQIRFPPGFFLKQTLNFIRDRHKSFHETVSRC